MINAKYDISDDAKKARSSDVDWDFQGDIWIKELFVCNISFSFFDTYLISENLCTQMSHQSGKRTTYRCSFQFSILSLMEKVGHLYVFM